MILEQQIQPSALFSLSHAGYTYTSAVMDIIDNSVEEYVDATRVHLLSDVQDGKILKIIVADDGIGMDEDTLREAIYIGSVTGKEPDKNLGMYGMGLKTAAMSLGYLLEVYTKKRGSDKLLYGQWDIPSNRNAASNGKVLIRELEDTGHSVLRKYVNSEFGTVVVISKLRNIQHIHPHAFSKNMNRNVAIHFNKYIHEGRIKFYVNKRVVSYVDPVGTNIGQDATLMGEGDITVNNHTIRYKAWNIHPFVDEENESGDTNFIPRTLSNQGIYIYRQNRLVGNALTLGLFSRRTSINGFRVELFMDGSCDELFCSSFTKVIQEKKKEDIDPDLYEKLKNTLMEYWVRVEKEYKKEMDKKREEDPETKDFLQRICDALNQNENLLINARIKQKQEREERERRKQEKKEDRKEEQKEKKESENKDKGGLYAPIKRKHPWLGNIQVKALGTTALIDIMDGGTSSVNIIINTDHPYYNKVIDSVRAVDENLAARIVVSLIMFELARRDSGYYDGDGGVQSCLDRYERAFAKQTFDALK